MGRLSRLATRWERAARPRWTVRLRLTLLYGALFLASGAALLTITYVLVKQDISNSLFTTTKNGTTVFVGTRPPQGIATGFAKISKIPIHGRYSQSRGITVTNGTVPSGPRKDAGNLVVQVPIPGVLRGHVPSPKQARQQYDLLLSEARTQRSNELHQLLLDSGIALLIMAALSILLGWLIAGRALRPLRLIASKAQDISATNLHERIGLEGPDDEMRRLGDTFDALLARLERAFDAQRQFVSNASHELRTPLARQRTMLEVAAADPDADVASLRGASAKAISAGEEQERLIEALLTMANAERGLDERTAFDLAEVVRQVVESRSGEAQLRRVDLETSLCEAPTAGNRRLAERLAVNLVENALRYNEPRGWVTVTTGIHDGRSVLEVANSGQAVPEGDVERLFEPFQRLAPDRITREGHGLGLSIVRAVASAHGATVTARSRPSGGLDIRVAFPLEVAADVAATRLTPARSLRETCR